MSGQAGGVGHKTYARQGSGVTAGTPGWWTGRAAAGIFVALLLTTALVVTENWLSRPAAVPAVGGLAPGVGGAAARCGWRAVTGDDYSGTGGGEAASAAGEPVGVESPVDDPVIGQGPGFVGWFERDVEYLETLGRRASRWDGGLFREVRREIARLREIVAHLDESPSYRDPELGFLVYDARTTGWLHVLSVALRTREELVATRSVDAAIEGMDALYRLNDGTLLCDADPARIPRVDEVVSTLRAMDLPRPALDGYRVYLLPFSMGDVSGLGADGYTVVGAAAAGREVIPNQVPVTVAHEVGHHIQLAAMGATYRDNPAAWRRYMSLRGISRWTADGKVNTLAWAVSPEETFAEDVRVLFGPPAASQEPYGTAYPDPRNDPELAARLREFITAQAQRAGAGRAEFVVAGDASPWLPPARTAMSGWAAAKTLLRMCYERIADRIADRP
ncbi:MAG: hypothetical protein H5T95_06985 [Firmicutes bacterium]|nr:hypothetical protein [Bacillota bacterium]